MSKSFSKTLILLSIILAITLFFIGIVQSVIANSYNNKKLQFEHDAQIAKSQYEQIVKEHEYKKSQEYITDYKEIEEKYVSSGSKILEPQS